MCLSLIIHPNDFFFAIENFFPLAKFGRNKNYNRNDIAGF